MPRVYKRKPGSRRYCDYSKAKLEHCLNAIRNKEITQRQAEEIYNIPRRTIINKLKIGEKDARKPGYQQIFSKEEEKSFEKCVIGFCDFGFPLTTFDLRMIVHAYLNKIGKNVSRFKNNVPGEEWALKFIKRHPNLNGSRLASNIKRSRAAVDREVLKDYISNLEEIIGDVPSTNIWNYDESNLTDDPGKKKVIAKRGCKYPERICNSSKTSISLMMCGSASGDLLPPYVVYRSQKLWDLWTENCPCGARYNNTISGWFDSNVFTDWFKTLLLPKLKKLEGRKVVIGDNLSSHITGDVLELCNSNDISFVCLPPNSTHLTQPLDVAFFAPMKKAWRKVLSEWREGSGSKSGNLEKSQFPCLLKKLMDAIEPNSKENLISGFKKCGIFPLSLDELVTRLPQTTLDCEGLIEDSFLQSLEEKRKQWTDTQGKKPRRKALQVPAGKSIGQEDLRSAEVLETPGTSEIAGKRPMLSKRQSLSERKKKKFTFKNKTRSSNKSSEDEDENIDDLLKDLETLEAEKKSEEMLVSYAEGKTSFRGLLNLKDVVRDVGEYVVFTYEKEVFPGKIVHFTNDELKISAMQRSMKSWKWPIQEDLHSYDWDDVLGRIDPPKQISKRGFYMIPELNSVWDLA